MVIKVKDNKGKVFTNDMASDDSILEIHFCTSYTEIVVQEKVEVDDRNVFETRKIIIPANTKNTLAKWIDFIAVKSDEIGSWE